jgi:hypothetical protein
MIFKKIIILITALPLIAIAGVLDDYSEQVGNYVGMCYGLNYLQKSFCSSIQNVNPNDCIQNSINLLPGKYHYEFYKAILEMKELIKNNAEVSVKKGFNKTLLLVENDKEKACFGYASSAMSMNYMKYEEMKKTARKIQ